MGQNTNHPRVESQSGPAHFSAVFSSEGEGSQAYPIVGTNTMPLDRVRHLISEKPIRRLVPEVPPSESGGG